MSILASIESHLTDYELLGPYFTAHHVLLIFAAAATIGNFRFAAVSAQRSPKNTGLSSLL